MPPLVVRPERLRQFGAAEGVTFCLVTNPSLVERFRLEEAGGYAACQIVGWDAERSFEEVLERELPEPAHVLVISPARLFRSPAPERLGRRKLMAMACNSTPTSLAGIAHFLAVMERTDPARQQAFADRFFALAERSECLEITDAEYDTYATFNQFGAGLVWNQQAGFIEWGGQQIAPAGEISVLPVDILQFDSRLRLPLEGSIALTGQPVLHSGAPSFQRSDQERLFGSLATMAGHALIATVQEGTITALRATHPDAAPAAATLEAMFAVDSRYRLVWEIGCGLNLGMRPFPGNAAMNEVYGAAAGVLHFVMGLTPFTQYAILLPAIGSRLKSSDGSVLAGAADPMPPHHRQLTRRLVSACPCQVVAQALEGRQRDSLAVPGSFDPGSGCPPASGCHSLAE
jgi:hypothetical protein